MDYERIYDRFAASVGFTYYVSVKLDVDLAWLLRCRSSHPEHSQSRRSTLDNRHASLP
jgi:hypothetical protein